MDIYSSIIKDIDDLKILKSQTNIESIINIVKNRLDHPIEFVNLLFENPDLSLQILERYKKTTLNFIESDNTLDKLYLHLFSNLIENKSNEKKNQFQKYDNEIHKYLLEIDFFSKCYDEKGVDNVEITKQDIINFKNENPSLIVQLDTFDWRINQTEAINILKKDGIKTGIHCQATGCGKTFIILKYIDWAFKSNPLSKIILFTERVSILADLFDFANVSNPIDSSNVKFWKEKGICDLSNFNIIDRVTVKKSDWVIQLNKSTGPTLLVINRAYLTLNETYKSLENITMILHDESHNVASNQCFEFLKFIKNKLIPIVGFSATPLRAGKIKFGDNMITNKNRLLEIYGLNDKLVLLTNYNMIYAISSNLILPPRFYWFDIENYQTKKEKGEQISKPELGSVLKILDEIIPLMANKKLIAWAGTIKLCDEWYNKFSEHKAMYPNLKSLQLFKDYSSKVNTGIKGYDDFKNLESNGIMFCAQKHREGSDIKKLDGCIFLDKVKNRGAIPFIQSIGRVLRQESNKNSQKKCGFIIDGVIRDDEDYDKNIVDKILGYYFALSDIASLDDGIDGVDGLDGLDGLDEIRVEETSYQKYVKLMDLIDLDPDEKIIKLKLANVTIDINCKKLDWTNFIKKFDSILGQKVKLNPDDKLKIEFEKLKKKALKIKSKSNLIESWKKYAEKKNIEKEPNIKYLIFWKGWYDFYQIDTSKFPKTKTEWIKKCKQLDVNLKNYKKIIIEHDNLPELPEEIYHDFKNLKSELATGKSKNLML